MSGIGGDAECQNPGLSELLNAAKVSDTQRRRWLHRLTDLERWELAAVFHLVEDCHRTLTEALEGMEVVQLHEATLDEVARDFFDDCYLSQIPEAVRSFIDYDEFARHCRMNGFLSEFRFDGSFWTCSGVS